MSKPLEKLEDAELIDRFKNGDEASFSVLVERHSSRAYQIAYGVLGSREDAQEVAQDVFVRIHKALHKFRGDAEFTTWMYRIAMNLARNKYRWNKCRGSQKSITIHAPLDGSDDGSRVMQLPSDRQQPDQEISTDEFEDRISEEIEKLPPLYREALVLRNVEDMSYEQIANVLGCKLGTIKSRIARAREELRRRLGL